MANNEIQVVQITDAMDLLKRKRQINHFDSNVIVRLHEIVYYPNKDGREFGDQRCGDYPAYLTIDDHNIAHYCIFTDDQDGGLNITTDLNKIRFEIKDHPSAASILGLDAYTTDSNSQVWYIVTAVTLIRMPQPEKEEILVHNDITDEDMMVIDVNSRREWPILKDNMTYLHELAEDFPDVVGDTHDKFPDIANSYSAKYVYDDHTEEA